MAVDTRHWNHVTNSGASKLTSVPLSRALFTNTVKIDTHLKKGKLLACNTPKGIFSLKTHQ